MPQRRNLRRIGIIAAAAAILIAVFGILKRHSHEAEVAQWTKQQAVPIVAVVTPETGAAVHHLVLPGTVQAWYEAPIYARVPGYLKDWNYDYGAHVKKGDVLGEIETPDLDAQLAAAQAKLNAGRAVVKVREAERQFAESTFQRWRDSPKGVVSVQEQESKQADYSSAAARLNSASAEVAADQGEVDRLQALESFKKILAPFDGVVTARETDIGALINAGSGNGNARELFRVADIHMMRIYVQVPQQLSAGIENGLTAELRLPQYPDKTFKAVVATTSSSINTSARTLLVELHANNPNDQLQPGAYAQVEFELPANPNVVRVPTSALIFRQRGMEVAIVGPDNKIELKPITLGRNLGTEVEVVKGLTAADKIVNSPPDSLASGDLVRVAGKQSNAVGQIGSEDVAAREQRWGWAMALKDLLVYVDQTENSLARLRLAGDLAVRHDGHLTALYVREWNRNQLDLRKAAEIGLVSASGLHNLDHQVAATIEAAADRLRATLAELTRERGLRADLITVDGIAAAVVPQYARYADLCILGRDEVEGPASINYTFSEQLLFVSGRPVLFVPPDRSFAALGRHTAVAWNSSRPAARALNDALSLIEHAERATIIMINPSGFTEGHPGPPGEQIVEHLKRHGADVSAVRLEDVPRDEIADRLQDEAQARGADLIVAGAFGHPRLWEKMLGGVTHDLIARMRLPVFMSH